MEEDELLEKGLVWPPEDLFVLFLPFRPAGENHTLFVNNILFVNHLSAFVPCVCIFFYGPRA